MIVRAKDDLIPRVREIFDAPTRVDIGRRRAAYLEHTFRKARRWWPEWDATLQPLPTAVLVSEALSRTFDGLWLREPDQFLHDALPRAQAYLDRFPPPPTLCNRPIAYAPKRRP